MGFVAYQDKNAIMDRIMAELETGRSLVQVCKDEGMPDRETVSRWMRDDPAYAAKYAYARAMQADTLFSEMADVEHKVQAGTMDSHAARVVLDSMRWRASKLAPKVYGDRLDVSVSDTRISISGALQAAQARLVDVVDVTHRALPGIVQDVQDQDDAK
tara:strand:+ start:2148 stop:2621 length:474 start_codon:yes stop_codon:yes gene_type:complete